MKIDTNRIAHTTWNCTTGKCVGKRLTKAFGCGIIRFGLLKITMKRSAFMTPDFFLRFTAVRDARTSCNAHLNT